MIEITPAVSINEDEIQVDFIRSSGPGGQNVNKVATAVQLRYNVAAAASLPDEVKQRLYRIAGNRMTEEGVLIIEARRFRSQEQNRADAVARLVSLVTKATEQPKPRKKTHPGAAAQAARLEEKKRRGSIKRMRRSSPQDFE